MSIEIKNVRKADAGYAMTVHALDLASLSRVMRDVLEVNADAFRPVPVGPPPKELARAQMERGLNAYRLPTASMPPYVQYPECPVLGGQSVGGFMSAEGDAK